MSDSAKSVSVREAAFCDLKREIAVTRKVLQRLPEAHFNFRPHEKSMDLAHLAMHTANLLQWMYDTLAKDELDMSHPPPQRHEPKDHNDLLATFDENAQKLNEALAQTDDAALLRTWTLRNGQQIIHTQRRLEVLRVWCLNHLVHHRGQLCLYLRLLNVPVPAVYFNSADEPDWVFI